MTVKNSGKKRSTGACFAFCRVGWVGKERIKRFYSALGSFAAGLMSSAQRAMARMVLGSI